MLRICRAEDGETFQVDKALWDIERKGSLEQFLEEETGVEQDAVLAYLTDGRRLTSENLRDLAGAQDNSIFVFNKYYLDYDLHELLKQLYAHPKLQPPVEDAIASTPPFRPHQLAAAYLHAAHVHNDVICHTAAAICVQLDALGIASRSLDLNILSLSEAFEPFAQGARRALDTQSVLLTSLDADLASIAAVRIHPEFLSQAVRKAVEMGERARTLGDYVSSEKMRQVADGCRKIHEGLMLRFEETQECMDRLTKGAYEIRSVLQTTRLRQNADSGERIAKAAYDKVADTTSRLEGTGTGSKSDGLLLELKQVDTALRNEVEHITDTKNVSTELCIGTLRQISALNSDIVQLPGLMGTLQADFRARNNFTHIHRLHNMIYAYGATLIEVVRRKTFSRFFYQRAQSILEAMANLTSSERKRRQIYRGEVHGQLPFDTKGMDDPVPAIDFSPTGGKNSEYSLERGDIDVFMQMLEEFERSIPNASGAPVQSLRETREALEKLIEKVDKIEMSFDRAVERSLLSSSRLSLSRRRLTDEDEAAFLQLAEKVVVLEKEKSENESYFDKEIKRYQDEIAHLKAELGNVTDKDLHERDQREALLREIHTLKAQNESDIQVRKILEQRHKELLEDIESLRKGEADALTDHSQEAENLRCELARSRAEYEEVKQLEAEHSAKVTQLLTYQTETLASLEEARLHGEDLRAQIESVQAENAEMNSSLKEAREQKERLLRAQAIEHDRIMRDHIAEADGDRAVLEQQFFETRAQLEQKEGELKEVRAEIEVLHADAAGLREELQRTEHALREAHHIERVLRNDLSDGRASQSGFEQKIANRDRLIAQILDVAIAFRNCHTKAFATLQPLSVHPATGPRNGTNPSDSVTLSPPRLPMSSVREEAAPIDPTDPAAALEILRSYDLDAFTETVQKVGSVMRRWQKQCREYRERVKGKITFRNFAKGDLALFLPTRNSVSKPWAAFNVSFPHYFLNATGRLAEQLKTREWIVARITSISEKIADSRDPDSNPYNLGDGIKYFMLDVEDWTRPGAEAAGRRKTSSARANNPGISTSPTSQIERPISPPLADDPESSAAAAEPLGPTRSPNSHLFPVRNGSTSAGPSSLSKLLAQASPTDTPPDVITSSPPSPGKKVSSSPPPKITGPPPPSPTRGPTLANSPNIPSPLRPGSRASARSSSRLSFSGGRIAAFARGSTSGASAVTPKAAPTTALSSENPIGSPPASPSQTSSKDIAGSEDKSYISPTASTTPSPSQSVSEGMSNMMYSRRRTTSEQILPTYVGGTPAAGVKEQSVGSSAASALASLATTLGMSMSMVRRKKTAVRSASSIPRVQEDVERGAGGSSALSLDSSSASIARDVGVDIHVVESPTAEPGSRREP